MDDKLRVDVVLAVGQVTEAVAVEATTPMVQTDSGTVGNVADNKKVAEMPLNGRNFLQPEPAGPGRQPGRQGFAEPDAGQVDHGQWRTEQANNFLLDGMDDNDLAINQYAVAISTEAIGNWVAAVTPARRTDRRD